MLNQPISTQLNPSIPSIVVNVCPQQNDLLAVVGSNGRETMGRAKHFYCWERPLPPIGMPSDGRTDCAHCCCPTTRPHPSSAHLLPLKQAEEPVFCRCLCAALICRLRPFIISRHHQRHGRRRRTALPIEQPKWNGQSNVHKQHKGTCRGALRPSSAFFSHPSTRQASQTSPGAINLGPRRLIPRVHFHPAGSSGTQSPDGANGQPAMASFGNDPPPPTPVRTRRINFIGPMI